VVLTLGVKVQVSLLPVVYGRQLYEEEVGAEPAFTYMSASPVPPEIVKVTVWPARTGIV